MSHILILGGGAAGLAAALAAAQAAPAARVTVLERNPKLMAYFIYADHKGNYAVWYSPSMKGKIVEEQQ